MKRRFAAMILAGLLAVQGVSVTAAQVPEGLGTAGAGAAAAVQAEVPGLAETGAGAAVAEETGAAQQYIEIEGTDTAAAQPETEPEAAGAAAKTEQGANGPDPSVPAGEEEIIITPETEAVSEADLDDLEHLLTASYVPAAEGVKISESSFPDSNFRAYVTSSVDTNRDKVLSAQEISAVTYINCASKGIRNLKGIEYFTSLQTLNCSHNHLEALDLRANTLLESLDCSGNETTETEHVEGTVMDQVVSQTGLKSNLNIKENRNLKTLICSGSLLTSLDISGNPALEELECSSNSIPSLNVGACPSLTRLICFENKLSSLDISKNPLLTELECYYNQIAFLDLSGHERLKSVHCEFNWLSSLKLGKNSALTELYCQGQEMYKEGNVLADLDVSGAPNLTVLYCQNNGMTGLHVSGNPQLAELYCFENKLKSLDVSKNAALKVLACYDNQLTTLDISGNRGLISLSCQYNELIALDITNHAELAAVSCQYNQMRSLALGGNSALAELSCEGNQLSGLNVSGLSGLSVLYCGDQVRPANLAKTDTGWKADFTKIVGSANAGRVKIVTLPRGAVISGTAILFTGEAIPEDLVYVYDTGYPETEMNVTVHFQKCTAHDFKTIRTEDSTCTKEGAVYKECVICGESTQTPIPKKAHSYKEQVTTAPTCTSTGVSYEKCTVCGDLKAGTKKTVPKTAHSFGEAVTIKAATVFQAGSSRKTCKVCGLAETTTLPKLEAAASFSINRVPLQVGKTLCLTPYVRMRTGDYINRWKSGDERIATVDTKGNVKGVKTGQVIIAAGTKGGAIAKILLYVQSGSIHTTAISGLHNGMALDVGQTSVLKPVITPVTTQDKLSYVSGNPNIVAVSQNGTIKGMHAGTANVYVRSGSLYHRITIKVNVPSLTAIINVRATGGLLVGATYQLRPQRYPAGSAGIFYYKSSDPSVATVSADGLVTAKKKGSAVITVTARTVSTSMRLTVR